MRFLIFGLSVSVSVARRDRVPAATYCQVVRWLGCDRGWEAIGKPRHRVAAAELLAVARRVYPNHPVKMVDVPAATVPAATVPAAATPLADSFAAAFAAAEASATERDRARRERLERLRHLCDSLM